MMAAHYNLDNLVAILDHNSLQITGRNKEVCSPYPIDEKFTAFGWHVVSVDGNDVKELRRVLSNTPAVKGKPTFVLANTIKGKGVSYMEDVKKWHHGVPSDEQYALAIDELNKLKTELQGKLETVKN
jgi:transketolase